jgi:hypothetical protein
MRMGHAALLTGTCSVAAADTKITSRENQVLKRNQLLAGIHWRRVSDIIMYSFDAKLESQAKLTDPSRIDSMASHPW